MKEKVLFVIDKDLKKQLQQEARERGLTLSSYIRLILLSRSK